MTHTFDPSAYGPSVLLLLASDRLPELGPGSRNSNAQTLLAELTVESLFGGHAVRDPKMANCCLAALWMHHDFLDESHTISQDIDSVDGSFWHGIMHRREPDAGNAKYWFRRIGAHPVVVNIARESLDLGYEYRSAIAFVDFCEEVRGTGAAIERVARQVQRLEWQLLFDWCWRHAI